MKSQPVDSVTKYAVLSKNSLTGSPPKMDKKTKARIKIKEG